MLSDSPNIYKKRLIFIGGGHSHIIALKKFAMNPIQGLEIILISDRNHAPYSGMFPGYLQGVYNFEEIHFDLMRICKNAGVRFINESVVGLDTENMLVLFKDRPSIKYDIASINVGSEPVGPIEHINSTNVIFMKPIYKFLENWIQFVDDVKDKKNLRIAFVGGGPSGVEVALAIKSRFASNISKMKIYQRSEFLLGQHSHQVQKLISQELDDNYIEYSTNTGVNKVINNSLVLENGQHEDYDWIFWATQAKTKDWIKQSNLPINNEGFLKVDKTLKVESVNNVFATGDCIQFSNLNLPKSGVFAVRQGPILYKNLIQVILKNQKSLTEYKPQKKVLALLGTGKNEAILSYGAIGLKGKWIWNLKKYIDKKFMNKFQMNEPIMVKKKLGNLSDENSIHMCLGCGSKVGPIDLRKALKSVKNGFNHQDVIIDMHSASDAAVLKWREQDHLVATTDTLKQFVEDSYLFGKIAAIHATNDLIVMGARPLFALLTIQLDHKFKNFCSEELAQLMTGLNSYFAPNMISIVGGHTYFGEGTQLTVQMLGSKKIESLGLDNKFPQNGDVIILTKPIGSGILLFGNQKGLTKGVWLQEMLVSMELTNSNWNNFVETFQISGMTDVTGFGLIVHLQNLIGDKLGAEIDFNAIPKYSGVDELLKLDCISPLSEDNKSSLKINIEGDKYYNSQLHNILFDPQTAGGYLMTLPREFANDAVSQLRQDGFAYANVIGEVNNRNQIMLS